MGWDAPLPRGAEIAGPSGQDWRDSAACARIDPEVFFPEKRGRNIYAKAVCAVCPVVDQCLEYALEMERNTEVIARAGVWGGLSVAERSKLLPRRETYVRRPRAGCGSDAGAKAHRRRGEIPCEDCLEAERAATRARQRRFRVRTKLGSPLAAVDHKVGA